MATTPSLTSSQTRLGIEPILTEFMNGYLSQNDLYVWNKLFPAVPVSLPGGQILQFGKESFRLYNSTRAPGGSTNRISFGYAGKSYATLNKALEAIVPDELQRDANVMPGIDLAKESVSLVGDVLSQEIEYEAAQIAQNAANYGTNNKVTLSGTSKWSDAAALPIRQMRDYKEAVRRKIGRYPNIAIAGPTAANAAKENASVKSQFVYTSADVVTDEMLAKVFELSMFITAKAVYAATDNDADDFTDIWGNNIILAYVPMGQTQSMRRPSYGYTYTLRGNPYVKNPYRDENRESWVYGTHYERAPVLTGMDAGYLVQAVA